MIRPAFSPPPLAGPPPPAPPLWVQAVSAEAGRPRIRWFDTVAGPLLNLADATA